jgi:hypothetical protein
MAQDIQELIRARQEAQARIDSLKQTLTTPQEKMLLQTGQLAELEKLIGTPLPSLAQDLKLITTPLPATESTQPPEQPTLAQELQKSKTETSTIAGAGALGVETFLSQFRQHSIEEDGYYKKQEEKLTKEWDEKEKAYKEAWSKTIPNKKPTSEEQEKINKALAEHHYEHFHGENSVHERARQETLKHYQEQAEKGSWSAKRKLNQYAKASKKSLAALETRIEAASQARITMAKQAPKPKGLFNNAAKKEWEIQQQLQQKSIREQTSKEFHDRYVNQHLQPSGSLHPTVDKLADQKTFFGKNKYNALAESRDRVLSYQKIPMQDLPSVTHHTPESYPEQHHEGSTHAYMPRNNLQQRQHIPSPGSSVEKLLANSITKINPAVIWTIIIIVVILLFFFLIIIFEDDITGMLSSSDIPVSQLSCGTAFWHNTHGTSLEISKRINEDFRVAISVRDAKDLNGFPPDKAGEFTYPGLATYNTICLLFGAYENSSYLSTMKDQSYQFNDFGMGVIGTPDDYYNNQTSMIVVIDEITKDNKTTCAIDFGKDKSGTNTDGRGRIFWTITGIDACVSKDENGLIHASPRLQFLIAHILAQSYIKQQEHLNKGKGAFVSFVNKQLAQSTHLLPTANCAGLYASNPSDVTNLQKNCFADMVGEFLTYPKTVSTQLTASPVAVTPSTDSTPSPIAPIASLDMLSDYPDGSFNDYYQFALTSLFNGQPFFVSPNSILAITKEIAGHLIKTFGRSEDLYDQFDTYPSITLHTSPPTTITMGKIDPPICLYYNRCVDRRYWCSDLVIDSYNIAMGDKNFLDQSWTAKSKMGQTLTIGNVDIMIQYFQKQPGKLVYYANDDNQPLKHVSPGFAIFFNDTPKRYASHVGLIKSFQSNNEQNQVINGLDSRGNGWFYTYEANSNGLNDEKLPGRKVSVLNWKAVGGTTVVGFGGLAASLQSGTAPSQSTNPSTCPIGTSYWCLPSTLQQYGWSAQDANIASGICMIESNGGNPNAFNSTRCASGGDYSVGLFQINFTNQAHHDLCSNDPICTTSDVNKLPVCIKSYTDPVKNIQTAVAFKKSNGWTPWKSEGPTSKYKCWQ